MLPVEVTEDEEVAVVAVDDPSVSTGGLPLALRAFFRPRHGLLSINVVPFADVSFFLLHFFPKSQRFEQAGAPGLGRR